MLRVESPDVGGSFGLKNAAYPEFAAVLWAARRLGRPVRWLATRNESFLGDDHARDNLWRVELAFDSGGLITGVHAHLKANLGAYLSTFGTHCPLNNLFGTVGPYAIPAAAVTVEGYYTNTSPVAAYRGAGRPEACYAIERTLDVAALRLGMNRIELRRKNLIPPARMPWKSALGAVFDSGDFPENLRLALEASRWDEFPQRRERSAEKGRLRGIGLANHIESAGSTVDEMAEVQFAPDGSATVFVGTPPQGQGHETMLRQFIYELIGAEPASVRIVHSDTDAVHHGQGTFGSRAASVTSAALVGVVEKLREKAAPLAAELLSTRLQDLEFRAGQFRARGTNRVVSLSDVARASFGENRPETERGLGARHIWRPLAAAFPSGCHVCELEIDPETGSIELMNYIAVEDCGRIVNPTLLAGQIHGGVLQGVGQAMMESIVYDASGQLISGSFIDYAMPRASDFICLRLIDNPHPTSTNPLGIKGAGESGTVGALPAVMNAVADALRPYGIEHLDMPASPQRVWNAMRKDGAA